MSNGMSPDRTRREFLRDLGIGAAAVPFALSLPSLGFGAPTKRKQRLIVMFSPNGIVPPTFWPDEEGEAFKLKESLTPLEPLKDRLLTLYGVCDKIRGDGDSHMRGIGCLLTGVELFPGNIQGGSDTPAGWASGLSIDQEIKNHLQADPATRTRFGSLEFGVLVRDQADTWTRMSYAGPNKPLAPIDDPYQMFDKLYGQLKDRESLRSVLDELREDLRTLRRNVSTADRHLLEEHEQWVREMERELREQAAANREIPASEEDLRDLAASEKAAELDHAVPELQPGVAERNDNMPQLAKMQMDLLVQSLAADFTRVATLQFTNSVGNARMTWLGVKKGHHSLSHAADKETKIQAQLTKINKWYCEQLVYLAQKLAATPEPDGNGSLLDNTTIIWTNELGKGNSHTLNNIPFVLVGGGLGFRTGRSLKFKRVPHNRLLLSLAHAFGHEIKTFGNPDYCGDGPLALG